MTARTDLMAQNDQTLDIVEVFWNARPCNWHSPKPVGTREYFDEVEQRKHFVEPHIPEFAQFDYWAGKRVLEAGCGIGTAAANFAHTKSRYLYNPCVQPSVGVLNCLKIWRWDVPASRPVAAYTILPSRCNACRRVEKSNARSLYSSSR